MATSRREFMFRICRASLLAGCSGALAAVFHDRNPQSRRGKANVVKSFSVAGTESEMAVARGSDGAIAAKTAVAQLGGIGRFVVPGDHVLIKPNCAFDRPPHLGATSSPEVVGAVVAMCKSVGAEVRVIDNPINDAEGCFMKSGLMDAVQRAGGDVWLPTHGMFRPTKIGRLRILEWDALYTPLSWATKIIGVPTVKTHNLCSASLSMKNWYGLIGTGRNRFHQAIHDVVADLGLFISPTLVVLDGTRLLVRNGPTGGSPNDVVPGNVVAVGTDQVALDAFGADLLGIPPADVAYIQKAADLNVGSPDWRNLKVFKETIT